MKDKLLRYIRLWENRCYHNGIPDEANPKLEDLNRIPTYRKICKAILKNDVNIESLGYSRPPCEAYNQLKKIELIERGKIKLNNQLKLNL